MTKNNNSERTFALGGIILDQLAYIFRFLKMPNKQLEIIFADEKKRNDVCPSIGPITGSLLYTLIQLIQAKNVIEFGTCLGYSTIWLAQALTKTNGQLTSIEASPRLFNETRDNLVKAGLHHRVNLLLGRADEIFKDLAGPYDLILQDAAKDIYLPMLNECVEKLRPGGLLISDDVLFPTLPVRQRQKELMEKYNQALFEHPELDTIILPLGDGLAISRKKG